VRNKTLITLSRRTRVKKITAKLVFLKTTERTGVFPKSTVSQEIKLTQEYVNEPHTVLRSTRYTSGAQTLKLSGKSLRAGTSNRAL